MISLLRQIVGFALRLLRVPGRSWKPVGFGLLAVAAGWSWGVYSQPSTVSVLDVHEADGIAVRGGVMDIIATVDQRCGTCVTDVRRWLWRKDPLDPDMIEWAYLKDVPFRPPTPVGHDRYHLIVPVPPYVEAGEWHYFAQADDRWEWWRRWFSRSRESPDVLVHVRNPSAADPAVVVAPPGAVMVVPAERTSP